MRLRGLHDIKTHITLAREGRLISVARDFRQLRNDEGKNSFDFSDWNIERHIYKKKKPCNSFPPVVSSLHRELGLANKVRLHQIEVTRDLLQEIKQAMAEGIPVARHELERLEKRLADLEAE